ncbi:ADP-ribosyl cyclase/cyclic ADP-ribose hydrolase [Citrus sinensis]|uniref:disease resistance protein RPV1-like isoform X2 n=1 Tax=Citrus sinensis TaxID=2711 RepID=UPI00219A8278|nr:disease resistance protein RPV1-like isoform X2 [Citrus sinensis]KAH9726186.1 ADP-ribosyl cyclase/cyclic ADP-ribose hydrolase [Citrus sinensis]
MASSYGNNKKHDLFVSFRGEDTRDNFTSHLYSALCRQNIQTFIDDQLNRGDEISESLVNAIEASAVSVIVFSEGYASSRWCLDELVKILECKKEYAQIVIPVFYRVDPSDVRNQTGSFGDSFSKLEERFKENSKKLLTWRNALREAATLSGFNSLNIRPESELINEVVNHILKRLLDQVFRRNDNKNQLVGVESRVEEIESLLGVQSKDVYALGIWGIGGIGKTTIARATFDKISSDFEGSCFLENVREESQKPGGLACLRQKLLSNLLKDKNVSLDIGLNFRRLSRMKVLIVFDDVTCFSQLESIIGSLDWLTPVSRIIITTRNKQVLRNWGVSKIYVMEALEYHHALELFSRHAFKQNHPEVGYEKFSSKVMKYAQGVPLALKVLGCFLYEREKEVWESAINKLQRILHPSILEVLKISYNSLDDKEKNIFLDVACFFQGEDVNLVMKFHNASGFYPEIGISVLVDKSLIAIDSYNKIRMHDLLQELGREIVRQESINPGNRSRLWHHEDIYEVLTYNTGTEKIEGICLDMSKVKELRLNPNTFTKMPKLRFLKFYSSLFNGENKCKMSYLQDPGFAEVKYLHWHGYPLKSFPSNLSAEKLMLLEVPDNDIEQLWDCVKHYSKLNQIIHAACHKLIAKIPNPTLMPRLNKLVILNLRGSKSLKSLPSGIFNLEFLTKLDLSGCPKLKRLPEISSGNISWLFLRGTAIEELPSSIERLLRLGYLDLSNCKRLKNLPSSLYRLKSLGVLNLCGCSNLQRLPECLGQLSSPITFNLAKTNIERIPESSIQLFVSGYLLLSYGERFQFVQKSPFLERGCLALQPFLGIVEDTLRIQHTNHTPVLRLQEIWQERGFSLGKGHIVLPGNEIPKWFEFQSVGSFITLEMPPDFFNNSRVQGIAFSAILAFSDRHVDCGRWFSFSFELKVKTTKDCGTHDTRLSQSRVNYVESYHLHLGHYLFCEEDFNGFWKCNCILEAVHFNVFPPLECQCCGVKKCGIHLLHTPDPTSMEDPSTCFNCNEED